VGGRGALTALAASPGARGGAEDGSDAPPPPPDPMQKHHSANTGFCAQCDTYIRRALADQFGYKVAAIVLTAATVDAPALVEVNREAAAARLEAQPVVKRPEPMSLARPVEKARLGRLEREAAKARAQAAQQRSAAFAEHAEKAAHTAAALDLAEPPQRTVKYISSGDKWLECFDDESGRLFYYNVTDGARQWRKPPVQQWNLVEGEYTPLAAPLVFPRTVAGDNAAALAEEDRLSKATKRALAAIKVKDSRAAGVGPRSERGADVGPASARVIPGSFRVQVAKFFSYFTGKE
jgi:hypothetical protein